MSPAQFSPHCGENCIVRKDLCRPQAMPQLLLAPATPILYRQLLRQRGHDLLPVFSSRSSQDIIKNAATNLPVQQSEFRVHCGSRAGTGTIDKLSDVVEQG